MQRCQEKSGSDGEKKLRRCWEEGGREKKKKSCFVCVLFDFPADNRRLFCAFILTGSVSPVCTARRLRDSLLRSNRGGVQRTVTEPLQSTRILLQMQQNRTLARRSGKLLGLRTAKAAAATRDPRLCDEKLSLLIWHLCQK